MSATMVPTLKGMAARAGLEKLSLPRSVFCAQAATEALLGQESEIQAGEGFDHFLRLPQW